MTFRSSKDLKMILHPYAFILKGGREFNKNLLDYNLMLLQMNCPETIRSPVPTRKVKLDPTKTYTLAKKELVKKKINI